MKRGLSLGVLATALLAVACAGPAAGPGKEAAAAPKRILMGSTQTGSSVYLYCVAAAKVINSKVPEVNITVVETGAGPENIKRMERGEFELAGSLTLDQAYLAYNGLEAYKDRPFKDLRYLWVRSVTPIGVIVREDSGIKKLEELDGKDFNPGMRGSAAEANTKAMLEALGIKPKWYVGGLEDALAAIKDKRIVGFSKALPGTKFLDASVLDLMTFTQVRMLPFSEEQMRRIKDKFPWTIFAAMEAGVFKADWNRDPIPTYALISGGGGTTRLPEDLAYKMVKAIVEDNRPGGEGLQAAAFPGVKGEDLAQQTVELANMPLHTGAIRYYKEVGLKIKDEQIPPEAKR